MGRFVSLTDLEEMGALCLLACLFVFLDPLSNSVGRKDLSSKLSIGVSHHYSVGKKKKKIGRFFAFS